MKIRIGKDNFILFYLMSVTSLYPVLFAPDRVQALWGLARYPAVLIHYSLVFLFFFLFPALVLSLVYKEKLRDFGVNLKARREGLRFIFILLPILFLLVFLSSRSRDFVHEYPLAKVSASATGLIILMEFFYLLYYTGWEFLFRGMVMLGLKKHPLPVLLALQTIPSVLLHYSKPAGEIILALAAGILLGIFVYKHKTVWFALLLHFLTGVMTDLLVLARN